MNQLNHMNNMNGGFRPSLPQLYVQPNFQHQNGNGKSVTGVVGNQITSETDVYAVSVTNSLGTVQQYVGGRQAGFINSNVVDPLQKIPFNPEDDTLLCRVVLEIGEESWGQVASAVQNRSPYECWVRWNEIKVRFYNDILSKDDTFKGKVFKLASFSSLHHDPNIQQLCCILNCKNEVKNRSRFSLRAQYKFKPDYIKRSWNKICTKHYFADLYKFKKRCRGKK